MAEVCFWIKPFIEADLWHRLLQKHWNPLPRAVIIAFALLPLKYFLKSDLYGLFTFPVDFRNLEFTGTFVMWYLEQIIELEVWIQDPVSETTNVKNKIQFSANQWQNPYFSVVTLLPEGGKKIAISILFNFCLLRCFLVTSYCHSCSCFPQVEAKLKNTSGQHTYDLFYRSPFST